MINNVWCDPFKACWWIMNDEYRAYSPIIWIIGPFAGSQSKSPEAQNASEFCVVLLNHSGEHFYQAHSENIHGNINDRVSRKHMKKMLCCSLVQASEVSQIKIQDCLWGQRKQKLASFWSVTQKTRLNMSFCTSDETISI